MGLGYLVVAEDSCMAGQADIFSFNSKTNFREWYRMFKHNLRIIAQGITGKEALKYMDNANKADNNYSKNFRRFISNVKN